MALRWTRELLDLLEECEVTPYRSSGPGGQRKNKKETAVRVVHRPTGISRVGTESRSQSANKLLALSRVQEEILRRNRPKKKRKASRPTEASRMERLSEKRNRSAVKKGRDRPSIDGD